MCASELATKATAPRLSATTEPSTPLCRYTVAWWQAVREQFLLRKVKLTFVPTEMMRADDKTKVVHKAKFLFCRRYQMNLPDMI